VKKVVTAQQVAKQAGVSPTTVSFVMNNVEGANISQATRERVLKIAEELGYVPHALAKSLAKGRSDNIGLFLVQPHPQVFADPYIPNIINGIRQAVQSDGFRILVEQIQSIQDADVVLTMLKSGEIAGAIVTQNIWNNQQKKQLRTYPIVSLVPCDDPTQCFAAIDHQHGVQILANHLISLSRQPIGVIAYASLQLGHIQRRLHTFRETLAQHGYTLLHDLIRAADYQPQSGYDAMADLHQSHPDIQAVYCMNDMTAVGALAYLSQHGVRVPDDIAVVGYDDIRVSAFLNPPLTTVRAPEVQLGESAGDLLLKLINGESPDNHQQLLPTQLVIRQSCGYTT
jgi:DNA-binding LacI/PurR family transcriptional regulator